MKHLLQWPVPDVKVFQESKASILKKRTVKYKPIYTLKICNQEGLRPTTVLFSTDNFGLWSYENNCVCSQLLWMSHYCIEVFLTKSVSIFLPRWPTMITKSHLSHGSFPLNGHKKRMSVLYTKFNFELNLRQRKWINGYNIEWLLV